jgi:hypothetical protein
MPQLNRLESSGLRWYDGTDIKDWNNVWLSTKTGMVLHESEFSRKS